MNEEGINVPVLNKQDGKPRWIKDKRVLNELLSQEHWVLFPPANQFPEKTYWPEYDGNLQKKLGQEALPISVEINLGEKEKLEVISL